MGQNKWKYNKKSHIWKRVRPFLRGKKIIVNQILFSKLRYIGQVCTIQKHIKKAIEKRIYNFLWNRKNTTSQTPNSTFHVWWWGGGGREGGGGGHRHAIKQYKYEMDSKVIKSHQCPLERSCAILIKISSEFWSRPSLF